MTAGETAPDLAAAIEAAVRSCRVEDGSPAPLIRETDVRHVTYMVTEAVERVIATHVEAARREAVAEARDELVRMLETFSQQGRHTRARWAVAWLDHIIERLTTPPTQQGGAEA